MDSINPQRWVKLIVDEWGTWYDVEPGTNPGFLYQQNTMRDAIVAGLTLNIFNKHADRVMMANIAQTVNVLQSVLLTDGEKMIKTPTYYVFKIYKEHQRMTANHFLSLLNPLQLTKTELSIQQLQTHLPKNRQRLSAKSPIKKSVKSLPRLLPAKCMKRMILTTETM